MARTLADLEAQKNRFVTSPDDTTIQAEANQDQAPLAPLSEPSIRLPDDVGLSAAPPSAPASSTRRKPNSTIERIKTLEQMDSHFIFPFGRSQSGKTVAMSSLIYFMSSVDSGGKLHAWDSPYGSADETHAYIREVNKMFASKHFPSRTMFASDAQWDRTRQINVDFVPTDTQRKRIRLTFVDMSGDDHQDFADGNGKQGLPPSIEIFFQANRLSLTFVLVTRHQDAHNDDEMMVSFLNHIIKRDPSFERARVLLLVSHWDTYSGDDDISAFVKRRMPMTYAKTLNPHNAMINFTIGAVGSTQDDDGNAEASFIKEFDPSPSRKILHWLYQSFIGVPLVRVAWWKKFLKAV